MGLIQHRRLFHVIFAGIALLCLLLAFRSTQSSRTQSSDSHSISSIKSTKEETLAKATTTENLEIQKSHLETTSNASLDKSSSDKSNAHKSSKNEKNAKQTIMTLAEVKKADSNPASSNIPQNADMSASLKETTETLEANENTESNANAVTVSSKVTVNTIDKKPAEGKELAKQTCDIVKVKKGDSLTKIFKRQGYSQKDLEALMSSDLKTSKKFKSLQVKQTLKIFHNSNHQVQALALETSKGNFIQLGKIKPSDAIQIAKKAKEGTNANDANNTIGKVNDKLNNNLAIIDKGDKDEVPNKLDNLAESKGLGKKGEIKTQGLNDANAETQIAFGKGTVKDSLYLAGKRAGLDRSVVSQLVEIFGWNIDFSLVQPNDSFRVLFEEKHTAGEKIGSGHILAAEMTYKGKVHRAVRYTDKAGHTSYFSPEGYGMKETFSRYPLAFSHVSSGFGNRKHPIRHKMRKHTGVDFAAPRGTPVNCTGDGKVTFAGTRGGYGRVIEIQHGEKYSTLYAHLLKFAPKLKAGDTVKKGQHIGNVGRTGLATGNHLHYEFRVDGVHRDPLTITLPKKSPIPDSQKRHFLAHAKEMLKLMNQHENKINMVRNEYPRNE